MMEQLADALTLLDSDPFLWVSALCAEGNDFTAGLWANGLGLYLRRLRPPQWSAHD